MDIFLPDLDQIDPTKVWLSLPENGEAPIMLRERASGTPVGEGINSHQVALPHPFSMRRTGCGDHTCYFYVKPGDATLEAALEIARSFGFRTGPDDVAERGDPGYRPLQPKDSALFSAGHWQGRKTSIPSTLVRLIEESRDRNGFLEHHYLAPETAIKAGQLEEVDEDLFITELSVEEVTAALEAAGLETRPYLVACFQPEDLYFHIDEDGGDGPSVLIAPRKYALNEDDLDDSSLAVIPDVLGELEAEGTWEIRRGYSIAQVRAAMIAAGFAPNPKIIA